eukprot:m.214209 g.214209  ORF g.214209 m.214209 type:complete len:58 (+) comp39806_c0_seq23:657-830(+)
MDSGGGRGLSKAQGSAMCRLGSTRLELNKPFIFRTDARDRGIGGELGQMECDIPSGL